jgi:hypothetical protein
VSSEGDLYGSARLRDHRIHQAIGVIIAQADVSVDVATNLMSSYAQAHSLDLTQVAIDVVGRRISFE